MLSDDGMLAIYAIIGSHVPRLETERYPREEMTWLAGWTAIR